MGIQRSAYGTASFRYVSTNQVGVPVPALNTNPIIWGAFNLGWLVLFVSTVYYSDMTLERVRSFLYRRTLLLGARGQRGCGTGGGHTDHCSTRLTQLLGPRDKIRWGCIRKLADAASDISGAVVAAQPSP